MKSFIYLNIYKLILLLFLITISMSPNNNQSCYYINNNHNLKYYLSETAPEEIIKKCFALSSNFGNDICC